MGREWRNEIEGRRWQGKRTGRRPPLWILDMLLCILTNIQTPMKHDRMMCSIVRVEGVRDVAQMTGTDTDTDRPTEPL